MIPLPPPDPALATAGVALDGDAIAEILDDALADVTVEECTPYYVRYKPARYLRVQYQLRVASDTGVGQPTMAGVAIYPPGRAAKLAPHFPAAGGRAVFLPRLSAIAELWAADVGLPGLARAASPEAMTRRLGRDLHAVLGGDLRGCRVEPVRYKAHKRAVLRYHLDGTPLPLVYGKLRKDGAGDAFRAARVLRRAGAPTPEPLAWLADIGMVVGAAARGTRLRDLRDTRAYTRWMPAVAESLAGLHDLRVDGLPTWPAHAAVRDLAAAAEAVGRLVPDVAPLASSLDRRLAPFLATAGGEPTATHGSFHDDQVLVGESGVTLIDTDGAMCANPLTDVGHFLAYLTADGAGGARAGFLDAYFSARPPFRDGFLPFEAASLLRWATLPFRELRPDWPNVVEQRVRLAADRLARHERGRRGGLRRDHATR